MKDSRRFTIRITTLALLLLAYLSGASSPRALAHTFHTSLMRLEYNAQEQTAEITVQVFAHDLETILTRRAGKSVRLDKSPDSAALTLRYLQDSFTLKNRDGQTKKLSWVGMEAEADAVLLYVETKMPEGFTGAQLRNQIFFDLLDDQINLVNARYGGAKTDLAFRAGDGFKPLADATGGK